MNKYLKICLIAFLAVIAGAHFSRAADDDIFIQQEITVSGEILACRSADFNGDSLADIAMVVAESTGDRILSIYLQRTSRRFPPTSSQRIVISPTVNMIQTLDIDKNGKADIFVVDRRGVWRYHFEGDAFNDKAQHVIKKQTLFAAGIQGPIFDEKFLLDVGGTTSAFVPVPDGFELYAYRQGKFSLTSLIPFTHVITREKAPVKSFVSRPTVFEMSLPRIRISDYNRDDLPDIYLLWPTQLEIFPQNMQGRYNKESHIKFKFGKYTRDNLSQAELVDFDRDGLLDLISCHSLGGLSDARTEIRFFGASQIINNDRIERQTINLTDICGNMMVGDFDGTDGVELVLPAIELGILTTVKNMISKKTDFHFLIYPIDNLGRPSKEPLHRRKVTCRLDFEHTDPTGEFLFNWKGDYNNDGKLDLVTSDGNQMMFYFGSAEDYIEKKAGLVLDIAGVESLISTQLNNDEYSDLIAIHEPSAGSQKITILVTNQVF